MFSGHRVQACRVQERLAAKSWAMSWMILEDKGGSSVPIGDVVPSRFQKKMLSRIVLHLGPNLSNVGVTRVTRERMHCSLHDISHEVRFYMRIMSYSFADLSS